MNAHETVEDPLGDPKDGHILTRAIIDTIHEPLIVLGEDLCVIAASLSFYKKFNLTRETTEKTLFYELGNGEWNVPALRTLLEEVIPLQQEVIDYVVDHEFATLGHRIMLVSAREIRYENGRKKMLVSIFDVTLERTFDAERELLLTQKDMLLREMQHRIANSLQLIASILMLKAETVNSPESRLDFEDAHQRIMSIATVQTQLDAVRSDIEKVPVGGYLKALCKSLARSMISPKKPIKLTVHAGKGSVPADVAVSLGLITTELVINSLKHAFADRRKGDITVTYDAAGNGWTLSVEDNGAGKSDVIGGKAPGLGTSIIGALSNQLHATIETQTSIKGTKVSILRTNTESKENISPIQMGDLKTS